MAVRDADRLGLKEEDITKRGEGPGIAGLFEAMGDGDVDAQALADSEDGVIINDRMSVMDMPEDSEEGIRYWENFGKGLRKSVFGEGLEKWALYTPVAAASQPSRTFPLIFLLHGAHNPIQLTESYGVVQVAAREECIVIAPENENWESIEEKLDYARKNLPVDWTRVYSIGYSFGGFMTSRNVLAHPDLFAGAGIGGMLFGTKVRAHVLDEQYYTAYDLTDSMLAHARDCEVPIALVMGEHEMLRLLPLWREPEGESRTGVIPLFPADKQQAFNNFRTAAGCTPTTFLSEGEKGASITEQKIGARFEETKVLEYHGRHYYEGLSKKPDGECLFRTYAVEGMVHWPSSMFAQLVWDHLKNYARNTQNGKLIRL